MLKAVNQLAVNQVDEHEKRQSLTFGADPGAVSEIRKELRKQVHKLHGPTRIKQELRQKGLDSLLIEQALEDLDVDWFEICLQAKEKKFSDSLPDDAKEKAKMIRYLQYRGHSMSIIMDILSP